jgi:excisionase family DNA binding protein
MQPTLGIDGAAELLGIHTETLRSRAAAGIIPGAKIGRAWVFVTEDLINYVRNRGKGAVCQSANDEGTGTLISLDRWAESGSLLASRAPARRRNARRTSARRKSTTTSANTKPGVSAS